MNNPGTLFLHDREPKLHTTKPVENEQERRKRAGLETTQKPAGKLESWMNVLEHTHMGHRENPVVIQRIKQYYYNKYVIKPENVPESTFLLEQRIARQEGRGTIEITEEFRERKKQQIIANQKASLDRWINYLISSDADYPMWTKYWAFTSMVQMGKIIKTEIEESGVKKEIVRFNKRLKDTVAAFPMLNARALAMTIGAINARVEEKETPKERRKPLKNISVKLDDSAFQSLLSTENFSKLYSQFLMEMPEYSREGLQETRGEWKIFKQGSDPKPLVDSLEGFPLEWCTADMDTARSQLEGGDFYVYYSINDEGKAIIPRLAIRMNGTAIGEVRGIAPNQNLDPYIGDVAKAKLAEFPDGKIYEKKAADMMKLTEIETKNEAEENLSSEDLRFLYQLDSKIEGFGYDEDPRIKEIIKKRDIKADLSVLTGYSKEQIGTSEDLDNFNYKIKVYYGHKFLKEQNASDICFPEIMLGDLYFEELNAATGMRLPNVMRGGIYFSKLESAFGLRFPEEIRGDLGLNSLRTAEGLELPEILNGQLDLDGLKSAVGLRLPETLNGALGLRSLQSAIGLKFPKRINGNLHLSSLKSADGLELPESVNGTVFLGPVRDADKEMLKIKYPNLKIEF